MRRLVIVLCALAPALPAAAQETELSYLCGTEPVAVTADGEGVDLAARGERWSLVPAEGGEGAVYADPDDPSTVYRSFGETAEMTLRGETLPSCLLALDEPLGPVAPEALARDWRITEIDGEPVPRDVEARIGFDADGTVSGRSGCNSFGGSWSMDGAVLSLGPFASTRMACGDRIMAVEARLLDLLGAVEAAGLDARGALVLTGPAGTLRAEAG